MEKKFIVKTFNTFEIEGMGKVIKCSDLQSKKLIRLLTYIIVHHKTNITLLELSDVLWGEEEISDPANTLKNLIYRLRKKLKELLGEDGAQLILSGKGIYYWNKDYKIELDSEAFEDACKKAENDVSENAIDYYVEAINLYKGEFIKECADQHWVITLSTYYSSLYLNIVKKACALLENRLQYSKMENICHNALEYELLDEEIHAIYIKSLILQGNYKTAEIQYQNSLKILYDHLGIKKPKQLSQVYELLMSQIHIESDNIRTIKSELIEGIEDQGAFFCEFGVFKQIYQLEVRRTERMGVSIFLSLISISFIVQDQTLPQEKKLKLMLSAIDECVTVLKGSLRSGDVICRYSDSQFLILLPTCQYETAMKVLERIERGFYKRIKKSLIKIKFSLVDVE